MRQTLLTILNVKVKNEIDSTDNLNVKVKNEIDSTDNLNVKVKIRLTVLTQIM